MSLGVYNKFFVYKLDSPIINDMSQKTLKTLAGACLIIAAVGVYILMLKNPADNLLTIPILLFIMVALALSSLRPWK